MEELFEYLLEDKNKSDISDNSKQLNVNKSITFSKKKNSPPLKTTKVNIKKEGDKKN